MNMKALFMKWEPSRMDFQVESMLTSSNRDRSMKEPDFDPVARRREFREYFARSCESHHKIALV